MVETLLVAQAVGSCSVLPLQPPWVGFGRSIFCQHVQILPGLQDAPVSLACYQICIVHIAPLHLNVFVCCHDLHVRRWFCPACEHHLRGVHGCSYCFDDFPEESSEESTDESSDENPNEGNDTWALSSEDEDDSIRRRSMVVNVDRPLAEEVD